MKKRMTPVDRVRQIAEDHLEGRITARECRNQIMMIFEQITNKDMTEAAEHLVYELSIAEGAVLPKRST